MEDRQVNGFSTEVKSSKQNTLMGEGNANDWLMEKSALTASIQSGYMQA
jgi:hypothetical protein